MSQSALTIDEKDDEVSQKKEKPSKEKKVILDLSKAWFLIIIIKGQTPDF